VAAYADQKSRPLVGVLTPHRTRCARPSLPRTPTSATIEKPRPRTENIMREGRVQVTLANLGMSSLFCRIYFSIEGKLCGGIEKRDSSHHRKPTASLTPGSSVSLISTGHTTSRALSRRRWFRCPRSFAAREAARAGRISAPGSSQASCDVRGCRYGLRNEPSPSCDGGCNGILTASELVRPVDRLLSAGLAALASSIGGLCRL
jgi:hypothetical protein